MANERATDADVIVGLKTRAISASQLLHVKPDVLSTCVALSIDSESAALNDQYRACTGKYGYTPSCSLLLARRMHPTSWSDETPSKAKRSDAP